MAEAIPFRRPVNWQRLRADEAERLIKERARKTGNVQVVGHPEDRSIERTILMPDLLRILREGHVVETPILNEEGEWEAVIEKRMKGTRDAGAATIVVRNSDTLIVKTVMWIDR